VTQAHFSGFIEPMHPTQHAKVTVGAIHDKERNPDEEGSYVQTFLFLYRTKDRKAWRF
jgi:hypothetical protein